MQSSADAVRRLPTVQYRQRKLRHDFRPDRQHMHATDRPKRPSHRSRRVTSNHASNLGHDETRQRRLRIRTRRWHSRSRNASATWPNRTRRSERRSNRVRIPHTEPVQDTMHHTPMLRTRRRTASRSRHKNGRANQTTIRSRRNHREGTRRSCSKPFLARNRIRRNTTGHPSNQQKPH